MGVWSVCEGRAKVARYNLPLDGSKVKETVSIRKEQASFFSSLDSEG